MTITAKYAATCAACRKPIQPGQQIEWAKGTPTRHTDCAAAAKSAKSLMDSPTMRSRDRRRHPDGKLATKCMGCGSHLDEYQQTHGYRYCSIDCRRDHQLGGQSGYVNGVYHHGSDD